MVAIDDSAEVSPGRPGTTHTGQIVLFAVLGSALLVAGSLGFGFGNETGWRLAGELVSRFSLLLFVIAMTVEPLGRLLPTGTMQGLGRERGGFVLAFAVAVTASLVCAAAPSEFDGAELSVPTIAYCVLTAAILLVMLLSGHPSTTRFLGAPAWRAMQRVATTYFWIVFTLTGTEHLVGPHRPDGWYGVSLLLLVGAVLIRFGDAFIARVRRS